MKILIVTPVYRMIGPAIYSWSKAFIYFQKHRSDLFDHLLQYAGAPLSTDINEHDVVVRKYVAAQEIFLAGDWDCMVCIEDDMIIPEDGLVELIKTIEDGADIAYGLYCFRHGIHRWSAFINLNEETGQAISTDWSKAVAAWNKTIPVKGVGLGFTAISREVLRTISFKERRGLGSNDWYLALDAAAQGYLQECNLTIRCGHFSFEPSPRIIWPDISYPPNLVRIEMLDKLR